MRISDWSSDVCSSDLFWIDETPVTNAQFARFIAATGYISFAEVPPNPADYPGMDPNMAHPGSLLFTPPDHPVSTERAVWWSFQFGASWRQPLGPGCQSACKRDPLSARKRDPLTRWRRVDRTRALALRAA